MGGPPLPQQQPPVIPAVEADDAGPQVAPKNKF